jgi:carbon monoxide dehydrogenase subunit G
MAVELDHEFSTDKSLDESYASILDLERVVPAVEGGSVTEVVEPEKVKAEILMRMGAMSMKLVGTVEVVEKDEAARPVPFWTRSAAAKAGHDLELHVTFELADGGGKIHTNAQITGKAASMGEGVVVGVLDALIRDFTTRVGQI